MHDNFETIYESLIMVEEVVVPIVLVPMVLDIDSLHKIDEDATLANQLIFVETKTKRFIIIRLYDDEINSLFVHMFLFVED